MNGVLWALGIGGVILPAVWIGFLLGLQAASLFQRIPTPAWSRWGGWVLFWGGGVMGFAGALRWAGQFSWSLMATPSTHIWATPYPWLVMGWLVVFMADGQRWFGLGVEALCWLSPSLGATLIEQALQALPRKERGYWLKAGIRVPVFRRHRRGRKLLIRHIHHAPTLLELARDGCPTYFERIYQKLRETEEGLNGDLDQLTLLKQASSGQLRRLSQQTAMQLLTDQRPEVRRLGARIAGQLDGSLNTPGYRKRETTRQPQRGRVDAA